MRRFGYSVQVIHTNGAPAPIGFRRKEGEAIKLAKEVGAVLDLETRVWNTRTAECVYPRKQEAL
jgi:hypothetical protein